MRNFTFLVLMLLATSMSFAQKNPIDFETGGYGADWTWNVFENDTNPALEFIANPDQSGINTSATVAKFTALASGQPYAGCETAHGAANLGTFVLDATNSTIKIMVWKSVISDVGIKLVSETGWAQVEKKKANTVVNAWEELTFDFSDYTNPPAESGQLDQVVVFPDFNLDGRGQENIIYFDNITFSEGIPSEGPATAAPAPPARDAADVISLFSEAYTNVTVDTWRTDWSSVVLSDVSIEGNAAKKYSTLDFAGIETSTTKLDITGMSHLHVDVWSADFTSLGIKIVDFGADGAYGGGDDVEHQVNIASPAQSEWVSLDIPLTDFANLTTRSNIAQYIIVGQPTGATTVYLDNMYFYTGGGTTVTEPTTAAPTPTHSADKVISLFSDAYTNVSVDSWRTDWSAAALADVTIEGNAAKKYSSLDFVGIETTTTKVNATEMTHLHVDIWSADFTLFGIKLVDFGADGGYGGGDDVEHQINIDSPAQSEWVSLDIPLTDFTGLTTKANLAQYILVSQPTGATTVYIDNMYFYDATPNSSREIAANKNKVQVYPNPAKSGTMVQLGEEVKQVEIFDFSGRNIRTLHTTSVINTEELRQGVYILRIRTNNNAMESLRLVVK